MHSRSAASWVPDMPPKLWMLPLLYSLFQMAELALITTNFALSGENVDGGYITSWVFSACTMTIAGYTLLAELSCQRIYNYYAVLLLWVLCWAAGLGGTLVVFVYRFYIVAFHHVHQGTIYNLLLAALCFAIFSNFLALFYWITLAICIATHRRQGGTSRPIVDTILPTTQYPTTGPPKYAHSKSCKANINNNGRVEQGQPSVA